MNDDGSMARVPDLMQFSQRHGIKVGTIADLIAYRLKNDRIVEPMLETRIDSIHGGEFRVVVYKNKVAFSEHIALIKGDVEGDEPLPVRMHALNVVEDVLGDNAGGRARQLHRSMRMIAEHGRGVVVLIREPLPTMVSDYLGARKDASGQPAGRSRVAAASWTSPTGGVAISKVPSGLPSNE